MNTKSATSKKRIRLAPVPAAARSIERIEGALNGQFPWGGLRYREIAELMHLDYDELRRIEKTALAKVRRQLRRFQPQREDQD